MPASPMRRSPKPPIQQKKPPHDPSKSFTDPQRENFCVLVASGTKVREAYQQAGYAGSDSARQKLRWNLDVSARISFLAKLRVQSHFERARPETKKTLDAKERLIEELERLAYSDVTRAVNWGKQALIGQDGEVIGVADQIDAIASADLPPEVRASIKSVTTKSGAIKIEFHDKKPALDSLAKILGLGVSEPPPQQIVNNNLFDLRTMDAQEASRRVAFLFAALQSAQSKAPALAAPVTIEGEIVSTDQNVKPVA